MSRPCNHILTEKNPYSLNRSIHGGNHAYHMLQHSENLCSLHTLCIYIYIYIYMFRMTLQTATGFPYKIQWLFFIMSTVFMLSSAYEDGPDRVFRNVGIRTPKNYREESVQYWKHCGSLKSRIHSVHFEVRTEFLCDEFRVLEVRAMCQAFCQRGTTEEARFRYVANPCEIRGV